MVDIDIIYYEAYRDMKAYSRLVRENTNSDGVVNWDKIDEELSKRYETRTEIKEPN